MAKQKSNDELILSLKAKIEEKKQLLKKTEKFSPVTNCIIKMVQDSNINVMSKDQVMFMTAQLSAMKTAISKEFPEEKFIINGFSVDEWLVDLRAKFNQLNRSAEETRLKTLEKRLHDLLSTDKKVELEIADLMKQI